jgi:hypothetical protein
MAQTSLDELKVNYAKLETHQEKLLVEHRSIIDENTTLHTQLAETTTRAEGDKQRLEGDIARQTSALAVAQSTIDEQKAVIAQSETANAKARQKLLGDIDALRQDLASAKGRESQTDKNSREWKDLARERKEEIERLKALLTEKGVDAGKGTETVAQESVQDDKFLGIF